MKTTKNIVLIISLVLIPLLGFSQNKSSKVETPKTNDSFKYIELKEDLKASAPFQKEFNEGRKYYNLAVQAINKMTFNETLNELNKIEDNNTEQFKKALPFFENAYKINPKNAGAIEGLSGCYFALSDLEKSAKFKKELDLINSK